MNMFTLMLMITLGIAGLTATDLSGSFALMPCRNPGWYEVGPFCAKYFPQKVQFIQAYNQCRKQCQDCNLISVHDAKTNDELKALTKSQSNKVWIGAYRLEHKQYVWTDGSEWSYMNWGPREPSGNGNCVQFNWGGPGKWDDVWCTYSLGYVCAYINWW